MKINIDMPSAGQQKDFLSMALTYISWGWPVFPVHSITNDGFCTCPQGKDCGKSGKHPRTSNGFKDATLSSVQIEEWWTQWPEANIGVATGKTSGIVVLDVDVKNNGMASFEELKSKVTLPDTLTAITGGGGYHLFFQYPEHEVKSSVGFMSGLDIRGDGGYVVVPPSKHISGKAYQWKVEEINCES